MVTLHEWIRLFQLTSYPGAHLLDQGSRPQGSRPDSAPDSALTIEPRFKPSGRKRVVQPESELLGVFAGVADEVVATHAVSSENADTLAPGGHPSVGHQRLDKAVVSSLRRQIEGRIPESIPGITRLAYWLAIWCAHIVYTPRESGVQRSSPLRIWAWRPFTNLKWRTCPSPWPLTSTANPCIKRGPKSGKRNNTVYLYSIEINRLAWPDPEPETPTINQVAYQTHMLGKE